MISRIGKPKLDRIGVATAYCPDFSAVLAETVHFVERTTGGLTIFHVGLRTPETDAALTEAVGGLQVEFSVDALYQEGENIAETLVSMCNEDSLDLLFLGNGQPQENLKAFIWNAPNSVWLLTRPQATGTRYRRIAVATDFGSEADEAIEAAHWLASRDQAELYVFSLFQAFADTKGQTHRLFESGTIAEETERLEASLSPLANSQVPIFFQVSPVSKSHSASEYLQGIQPDLVVLPAVREEGALYPPSHLDWIIQSPPADLWVMAPRVRKPR